MDTKDVVHLHSGGILFSRQKLNYVIGGECMELETVILNEAINKTQEDKCHVFSFICRC